MALSYRFDISNGVWESFFQSRYKGETGGGFSNVFSSGGDVDGSTVTGIGGLLRWWGMDEMIVQVEIQWFIDGGDCGFPSFVIVV